MRRGFPILCAALIAVAVAGPALGTGLDEAAYAQATRRPVAMVPGLDFNRRAMIPRGICRVDVFGSL
jgi:hypothetical protein